MWYCFLSCVVSTWIIISYLVTTYKVASKGNGATTVSATMFFASRVSTSFVLFSNILLNCSIFEPFHSFCSWKFIIGWHPCVCDWGHRRSP